MVQIRLLAVCFEVRWELIYRVTFTFFQRLVSATVSRISDVTLPGKSIEAYSLGIYMPDFWILMEFR